MDDEDRDQALDDLYGNNGDDDEDEDDQNSTTAEPPYSNGGDDKPESTHPPRETSLDDPDIEENGIAGVDHVDGDEED